MGIMLNVYKLERISGVASIREAIEEFEQAVDRKVCKEIDAGACGTRSDFRAAEAARDKMDEQKDKLIARCAEMAVELEILRRKAGVEAAAAHRTAAETIQKCWEEFQ